MRSFVSNIRIHTLAIACALAGIVEALLLLAGSRVPYSEGLLVSGITIAFLSWFCFSVFAVVRCGLTALAKFEERRPKSGRFVRWAVRTSLAAMPRPDDAEEEANG